MVRTKDELYNKMILQHKEVLGKANLKIEDLQAQYNSVKNFLEEK